MCVQLYRRCICGHKEAYRTPKKCEKAEKAGKNWLAALAGPKRDRSGYCRKLKTDSFGVPDPCAKCKAEGGQAYYPAPGGASRRVGPARMQAPLPSPPPQAHVTSSHGNGRGVQVPDSGYYEAQQSQSHHGRIRRPTMYEDPRPAPPRPSGPAYYERGPGKMDDNKARKESEKQAKKARRAAEKLAQYPRTKQVLDPSNSYEFIRTRALAQAQEERQRRPEPTNIRGGGDRDRPAPLNIPKKKVQPQYASATVAGSSRDQARPSRDQAYPSRDQAYASRDQVRPSREQARPSRDYARPSRDYARPSRDYARPSGEAAAYPDLRHHPAMRADVEMAVQHESFTARVHGHQDTRRLQHDAVLLGAGTHPNTYRRERSHRIYSQPQQQQQHHHHHQQQATVPQAYHAQPYAYEPPLARLGVDENGVSPITESGPDSDISAINVTQKIPYNYHRG